MSENKKSLMALYFHLLGDYLLIAVDSIYHLFCVLNGIIF